MILMLFHIALQMKTKPLASSLLGLYSDLEHPSCSPVTSVTFKTIHKPVSEACTVYKLFFTRKAASKGSYFAPFISCWSLKGNLRGSQKLKDFIKQ